MCSETSMKKPSKDLGQADFTTEGNLSASESNCEFEFNIGSSLEHESFSAAELFSNGVIVPTKVREGSPSPNNVNKYRPGVSVASSPPRPPLLHPFPIETTNKDRRKESTVSTAEALEKHKSQEPSTGVPRSSSLNTEAKKSLLCSIPLLIRSNSAGSAINQKKNMSKDGNKQNSQKRQPFYLTKSSSCSCSSSSSSHPMFQKPPSKRYGNGVQSNQVLNMPSSSIGIGSSNLFGFGCFMRPRKDQKSKK